MPHTKHTSKRKRRKEAVPVVGVVGVSLSLAGGASAATAVPTADTPSRDTAPPQITYINISSMNLRAEDWGK